MAGRGVRALASLALIFGGISLVAIGGANTAVPAMQLAVVDQDHFMSAAEFTRLFALAQAAPGPNLLVVTLCGWWVAGVAGALVATLAFLLPACFLAYAAGRVWTRFRDARWRRVVQDGLVPVSAGLMLAAAVVIVGGAVTGWRGLVVAGVVLAASLGVKRHPLWWLAGSALAGLAGFY